MEGQSHDQLTQYMADIYHSVVDERVCPLLHTAQAVVSALAGTTATRLLKRAVPQDKLDFMASVVLKYVQENRPIPILAAIGPKLPPFQVDPSEMFAMMVLVDLQNRVRQHYPAGLDISLRLEDLTLFQLVPDADDDMYNHFCSYGDRLIDLVRVLKADSFITVRQESKMMDRSDHHVRVNTLAPLFTSYIVNQEGRGVGLEEEQKERSAAALRALQLQGWRGDVTLDQREYLRRCYRRRYPGIGADGHDSLVSKYFANTLVRRQLRAAGDCPEWNHGRMELSFCEPLPDSEQFERTRVWYRSNLHTSGTTTKRTIPFWRNAAVTCRRGTRLTLVEIEPEHERLAQAPTIEIPLVDDFSLPVIVSYDASEQQSECPGSFG